MPQKFRVRRGTAGHPVDHDVPADTDERLMAMERAKGTSKRNQHPRHRRHFGDDIVQVVPSAQQSQTSTLSFPPVVEIQLRGNQFRYAVGMDPSVPLLTTTAYGDRGRSPAQINVEPLKEYVRYRITAKCLDRYTSCPAAPHFLTSETPNCRMQ